MEAGKGLRSPIIIGLFMLFTAFNLFLMLSERHMKDELRVLNTIVAQTGHDMNGEGYEALGEYYTNELAKMNSITQEKIGQTYESAAAFTSSNPQLLDPDRPFTEPEVRFVQDLLVTERYYESLPAIRSQYDSLDMRTRAEVALSIMIDPTSDRVDKLVYANYNKLQDRLEVLREKGEHLHLFFQGTVYKMHSFLYDKLLGIMLLQAMVMGVLMTAQIMNHEFDHRTHLLMYATRRGRRLKVDKLGAAFLTTTLMTIMLLSVNIVAFFEMYDYSGLWDVPIGTGFLQEYDDAPLIPWWSMTFVQYLFAVLALGLVLQWIFAGLTAGIALFVRNSYFVCLLFLLLLGIGLTLFTVVPTTSLLIFWAYINPFQVLFSTPNWFMIKHVFTTYPSYEWMTVSLWSAVLAAGLWVAYRRFKRRDLV